MVTKAEVEKYLQIVAEVCADHPLMDMHVHPFELFCGEIDYHVSSDDDGLYSSGSEPFVPPAVEDIPSTAAGPSQAVSKLFASPRFQKPKLQRLYAHTGPTVLRSSMQQCGITDVLLLPVDTAEHSSERQLQVMQRMFGGRPGFHFAYCVPRTVADEQVADSVAAAFAEQGVRAVKVHTNASSIDLTSAAGRNRLQLIVRAAGEQALPMIVHGGASPIFGDAPESSFGVLENLAQVDWQQTDRPVVIAHAGAYGIDIRTVETRVIPLIRRLLTEHDHLFVDLADLSLDIVELLIRHIPPTKIVFGSDALYDPQWRSIVKLLHGLRHNNLPLEQTFVKIASLNTRRLFLPSP